MSEVKESEAFSKRLLVALSNAGMKPTPTRLARQFNNFSQKWSVTPHGVRKWIKGEGFPNQDRLCILAEMLGVTPDWLRFGEKIDSYKPSAIDDANALRLGALYRQFDDEQQRHIIELLELLSRFNRK